MIVYIFDGSFEGYLTSIYESYYNNKKPNLIITEANYKPNLIDEFINISTNYEKANKVYKSMNKNFSYEVIKNIIYCFLSSYSNTYTLLYKYIRLAFKLGNEIELHLHNEIVMEIVKIVRRVNVERHSMLGFVRFKKIGDNHYYSAIEPDHNILTLIAPHFSSRFSNENFIIHDLKRNLAIINKNNTWSIDVFTKEDGKVFLNAKDEGEYETLWKNYFNSTSISSRENLKLQRQHMPIRYWKHLTEKL
ncbi:MULTISPECIES: TIGR03915 family putative DNA repair protein [unclassified Clostridium]|uniref:TIGR03915 family putative DNA repair protein n=1 Tax=unclassified Clostridium TaxID=2614128 RepID=UPI0025C2730D|nr:MULTISPECIES: TIGR03915 family putative DNA repair protein [unclassified Clostridium]